MDASGEAAGEDFGRTVEPNWEAAAVQQPAVAGIDDGAAAGGDYTAQFGVHVGGPQREHGFALATPETSLSLLGEDGGHRHTRLSFDEFVEIHKGGVPALSDTTPHGTFATSR